METQHNNEIIITWEKFRDNIRRFWWIILAAVLIGAVLALSTSASGKTVPDDSYMAESVFYLKSSDSGAQNNKEALNNYVDAYRENSLEASGEARLKTLVNLMSTEGAKQEIVQAMAERGFDDYKFDDGQVELIPEERLLNVTVKGESEEETLAVAEIYSTVIQTKISEMSDDLEVVLLQEPSENVRVEHVSVPGQSTSVMKFAFILALSLIAALIALFICSLWDKRFRDKNEVPALQEVPLLGQIKIEKVSNDSLDMTAFLLSQYVEKQRYHSCAVVSLGSKKITEELLEQMSGGANKILSDKKIAVIHDSDNKYAELESSGIDEVVLAIGKNDAKIAEVEDTVNILKIMDKKIVGIVYGY